MATGQLIARLHETFIRVRADLDAHDHRAQSIMLEMQETVIRARKSIAESRAQLNKWRRL